VSTRTRLAALLALTLILVAPPLTPMLSGTPSRKSVEINGDLALNGSDRMLVEDTDLIVRGQVNVGGDSSLTLRRCSLTIAPPESQGQGGFVQVSDHATFEAVNSTIGSKSQTGVTANGNARLRLEGVTVSVANASKSIHYSLEDWTFSGILAPYHEFSGVSVSQNASLTAEGLVAGYVSSSSKSLCSLRDSEIGVLSPVRQGVTLLNGTSVNLLQLLGAGSGPITGSHEGYHRAWNSSQLGDVTLPDVRLVDSTVRHIWLTAVGNATFKDATLTVAVLNGGRYRVEGGDIWLLALLNGEGVSEVTGTTSEYLAVFSFGSPDQDSVVLSGVTAQNTKFYSPLGRSMDIHASDSYLGGCIVNWGGPPGSSYTFNGCDFKNMTILASDGLELGFGGSTISDGLNIRSGEAPTSFSVSGDLTLGSTLDFETNLSGSIRVNREFSFEVRRGEAPVEGASLDLRRADQTIWAGVTDSTGRARVVLSFAEPGWPETGNLTSTLRLFTVVGGDRIITPVGFLSDTPVRVQFPQYSDQERNFIAGASLAALLVFLAYVARRIRVA